MELGKLIEQVTARIATHEQESAAFAEEVERGRDILDSSNGQKYHDGCVDALQEIIAVLREADASSETATAVIFN